MAFLFSCGAWLAHGGACEVGEIRPAEVPGELAGGCASLLGEEREAIEGQPAKMGGMSSWIELAWAIAPAACVVALDGAGSNEVQGFPTYAYGMGWGWQAALIRRAAVVVGNDSAGAHLAGTLGRPTVAVMGPTRAEVVFGHIPEVRPIAADVPCSGCHFGRPYNAGCDRGCRSLMLLEAADVLDEIQPMLAEVLVTRRQSVSVPAVEGHQYTSDAEAGILAGIVSSHGCRRILEIGTAEGRTAAQVLGACPSIERWDALDVDPAAGRLCQDGRYRLQVRRGAEIPAGTYDLVFVDGDHAYGPAMADSLLALATGAIVVWHDAGNVADVDRVLWELRGRGMRIKHVAGTRLAMLVP